MAAFAHPAGCSSVRERFHIGQAKRKRRRLSHFQLPDISSRRKSPRGERRLVGRSWMLTMYIARRAEGSIEVGCRNKCFKLDPRTSGINILPPLYVVPDTTYSMMWRIRFPDGRLSANPLLLPLFARRRPCSRPLGVSTHSFQ